jgi:NADPH:quinone reductase-like Zn-dependent oxidoreductase
MKAIVCPKYGAPDVLQLREMEKPISKDNEVLIKVHAASINAYDWHILRGDPFLVRMTVGLFKPRDAIPGADVAGMVETVGKNIKGLKEGDAVYGCLEKCNHGAYAEYTCATENAVALKPADTTFEEAASVPMAAVTALQGLRDIGHIRAGQKVLINGASGGVGTFAVQIAKSFGAEVTAVCSKRNLDMARSSGADHVIDYAEEDFTGNPQRYDLILDVAANHSTAEYMRILKPQGICVVVGFSTMGHFLFQVSFLGSLLSKKGGKRIAMLAANNSDSKDLIFMNGLLEARKVVPVIDGCYPLGETAKAFRYFEKEHARGKVVIQVLKEEKK